MAVKYVATRDSYSKQCRLYRKGQIYEFTGEPETPYFTPLDAPAAAQVLPKEPTEVHPVLPVETPPAMLEADVPLPIALAVMTKEELRKVLEARGLRASAKATKDEMIRAITDDEMLK